MDGTQTLPIATMMFQFGFEELQYLETLEAPILFLHSFHPLCLCQCVGLLGYSNSTNVLPRPSLTCDCYVENHPLYVLNDLVLKLSLAGSCEAGSVTLLYLRRICAPAQ
jgi:hypothetical protein